MIAKPPLKYLSYIEIFEVGIMIQRMKVDTLSSKFNKFLTAYNFSA